MLLKLLQCLKNYTLSGEAIEYVINLQPNSKKFKAVYFHDSYVNL